MWRFSSSVGLTAFHQPQDNCASPRLKSPRYWIVLRVICFLVDEELEEIRLKPLTPLQGDLRSFSIKYVLRESALFRGAESSKTFSKLFTGQASVKLGLAQHQTYVFFFYFERHHTMAIPLSRTQLALFFILLCPVNIIGLWW